VPVRRLTRGLRFQLTASYGLFFTLLMLVLAFIFRGYLASSINQQITDGLNQDWAALKGYLHIERTDGIYKPHWYYDHEDFEENAIVSRLQSLYIIIDEQGHFMEGSPTYEEQFGIDPLSRIRSVLKSPEAFFRETVGKDGRPYMIRAGFVYNEMARDENHQHKYFVAIARSIYNSRKLLQQFTWLCLAIIPLASIAGGLLGWITAGRALNPVMEVARTAQRISGSNLSMRIPLRGAHDELDYLIATFNQMISRLESSFTQIRQFSIDVSHELRTPITIIRGQLEVALFTAQTTEQYRDAIVSSLQDIERMSQIVRALLLLSQAETGQVVLQKSSLDLAAVVNDIAEQFEIPAEGAQVRLLVSGADQPLPFEADRVQIERMLSNLLSNAVKFTPEGGEVRVTLAKRNGDVELIVEDTGVGIPADHLPHIFDRFYRVGSPSASASPERGLGLGLSFVAWIAKAHGGSVKVESEPRKGTRFIILLPAGTADEPGNEQNLIATHG
jgi:heavy metal sensor kinase